MVEMKNSANKDSAIYLTNYAVKDKELLFNGIKESLTHVFGFIEVLDKETLLEVLKYLENRIDNVIVDTYILSSLCDLKSIKNIVQESNLFIYSDEKSWAHSITSLMNNLYVSKEFNKILMAGNSNITFRVLKDIFHYDADIYFLFDSETGIKDKILKYLEVNSLDFNKIKFICKPDLKDHKFDCILSTELKNIIFDKTYSNYFDYKLTAVDACIGGFSKAFIESLYVNESEIIRIDTRASLSSDLISILETNDLRKNVMGSFKYKEVTVVAGGHMGLEGSVIVDSITRPNTVIGVADGAGKVVYPPYDDDYEEKVDAIKSLVAET